MTIDSVIKHIEVLDEVAAEVAATAVSLGIDQAKARALGDAAATRVLRVFGGQTVYFPMGLGYKLARRNAEIRRRLEAGEDPASIARDFNLTSTRVGQIRADRTPGRDQRDTPPPRLRAR